MSTDPKPPKPMPSADEINAYLELSAARTRLRLPLAKGNALTGAASAPIPGAEVRPAVEKGASQALPVSGSKKLPTRREEPGTRAAEGRSDARQPGSADSADAVWRPFASDDET